MNTRMSAIVRSAAFAAVAGSLVLTGVSGAGAQTSTTVLGVIVIGDSTTSTTATTTSTTRPSTTTTKVRVVTCENARNHGEYVSAQPKNKRAEAARSDCGKKHDATTTTALGSVAPTNSSSTTAPSTTRPNSSTSSTIDNRRGSGKKNDDGDDGDKTDKIGKTSKTGKTGKTSNDNNDNSNGKGRGNDK